MVLVEARSGFVDGIDHDQLPAGDPGHLDDHLQGPDEQVASDPAALSIAIERELGEQDRWDLPRSTATDPSWHLFPLDHVRGDREVSDHPAGPLIEEYVGPRALTGRVAGVSFEPLAELVVPAVERLEIVIVVKRLDTVRHRMRRR